MEKIKFRLIIIHKFIVLLSIRAKRFLRKNLIFISVFLIILQILILVRILLFHIIIHNFSWLEIRGHSLLSK